MGSGRVDVVTQGEHGEVAPGSHACAVAVSDEELREITASFVSSGLARREQVLYFHTGDEGGAGPVLDRLADDRVPVSETLSSGQLRVISAAALRRASGPHQVRGLLHELAAAADAQGWAGLRLTGVVGESAGDAVPAPIAQYDAAVNEFVRTHPVGPRRLTALCLYDDGHYSPDRIAEIRAVHPQVLRAPAAYDDGLLRITRHEPTALRLAGEADHSNREVIVKLVERALDQALRSPSAPAEVELNLASLRFLDVTGAVALVHTAEEFPNSHRLVLRDVRPAVARVLDRCGAPFATQLVVTTAAGRARPAG